VIQTIIEGFRTWSFLSCLFSLVFVFNCFTLCWLSYCLCICQFAV